MSDDAPKVPDSTGVAEQVQQGALSLPVEGDIHVL